MAEFLGHGNHWSNGRISTNLPYRTNVMNNIPRISSNELPPREPADGSGEKILSSPKNISGEWMMYLVSKVSAAGELVEDTGAGTLDT